MPPTQTYAIPELPLGVELETPRVLRALVDASRALALVRGKALAIPNQGILIDTLSIQEAKASSAIENYVTTQDNLYRSELFPERASGAAKEVALYRDALRAGFHDMHRRGGIVAASTVVSMFQTLKRRDDGFRSLPGTVVGDDRTGAVVHVPPQDSTQVRDLMARFLDYFNNDNACTLDPLVKMAVLHHQFESIHPFPDGNGRIGRILNVLYLVRSGLLDIPVLYLSRHITQTKSEYYRRLQAVRDDAAWEDWVLYMLEAVTVTSGVTLRLIDGVRDLTADYKRRMRSDLSAIYSQELLNNLFRHPYTRIGFVQADLGISRPTATGYLNRLAEAGLVLRVESGRDVYFINEPLIALFEDAARQDP